MRWMRLGHGVAVRAVAGAARRTTFRDAAGLVVLHAGDELSGALDAYAAARRPRARTFQRESSGFARLALSTHARPRDLMMRLSPEAVRGRAMELLLRRHAPRRLASAG
jgi:hypothetical protein